MTNDIEAPEALREELGRMRVSLDGAILVHLRTRKVLDDPHLPAEEKVEKLGGIVGLAGSNAYRTADEEETRALKAVIDGLNNENARLRKSLDEAWGAADDKKILERFSEVMTLKSKTALQGDAMKMLYTQVRELERQLGETRESLAKRSDALTKADARLSRIRHELRYNPQITAQSHLNRVRRVAGVGRYSS